MFMGEYNHTIDAKGRLIVPAKFREILGDNFIVTKGLDGCLFVYPNDEWTRFEAYHLLIKMPDSLHVFSLPEQRHAKLINREEYFSHRF